MPNKITDEEVMAALVAFFGPNHRALPLMMGDMRKTLEAYEGTRVRELESERDALKAQIAEAVAGEREACLRLVAAWLLMPGPAWDQISKIVAAIRARGEKETG